MDNISSNKKYIKQELRSCKLAYIAYYRTFPYGFYFLFISPTRQVVYIFDVFLARPCVSQPLLVQSTQVQVKNKNKRNLS